MRVFILRTPEDAYNEIVNIYLNEETARDAMREYNEDNEWEEEYTLEPYEVII